MFGGGLIKGLIETARNFFGSYYDPKRFPTIFYPEEKRNIPENSRVFPFLVYDNGDPENGARCVSCRICEKECPVQCIRIVPKTDSQGKPLKRPLSFEVNIGACMGCQICAEVCPFDSIKMNSEYEIAAEDRFKELILKKHQLLKSDGYYHKIHPEQAAESDKRLQALRDKIATSEAAKLISIKQPVTDKNPQNTDKK